MEGTAHGAQAEVDLESCGRLQVISRSFAVGRLLPIYLQHSDLSLPTCVTEAIGHTRGLALI